jgi:hypothetical protein
VTLERGPGEVNLHVSGAKVEVVVGVWRSSGPVDIERDRNLRERQKPKLEPARL